MGLEVQYIKVTIIPQSNGVHGLNKVVTSINLMI
jgi:hypothetical protein